MGDNVDIAGAFGQTLTMAVAATGKFYLHDGPDG